MCVYADFLTWSIRGKRRGWEGTAVAAAAARAPPARPSSENYERYNIMVDDDNNDRGSKLRSR